MELGDVENGVKAPDFIAINPNGRVPAIIDHTNNDTVVWESGAILLYIAERFDTSGKFNGKDLVEKAAVWEWLMFQACRMSGLGPMQGQVGWFKRYHPVKDIDQSVHDRFINETYRIYGVLNKRLENRQWVALDRFTVAGLHISHLFDLKFDEFPHLKAYVERISKLPSVETAYKKLQA
ncbi:hypothetical protein Clacol_003172 [Clathrus columnatus]|uniref:Glutathione S-transferase n=1 Tax=Clathrus columnatus TaxID=1419009 RepID=A0AAV5A628_9AGAM|nr:hypothetical protein Clacol_003172 [Clathrus columnatus]